MNHDIRGMIEVRTRYNSVMQHVLAQSAVVSARFLAQRNNRRGIELLPYNCEVSSLPPPHKQWTTPHTNNEQHTENGPAKILKLSSVEALFFLKSCILHRCIQYFHHVLREKHANFDTLGNFCSIIIGWQKSYSIYCLEQSVGLLKNESSKFSK